MTTKEVGRDLDDLTYLNDVSFHKIKIQKKNWKNDILLKKRKNMSFLQILLPFYNILSEFWIRLSMEITLNVRYN